MGRRAHSLWNVISPTQNTIFLSKFIPLSHKTTTSWLDRPWRFCLCKRAAAIEIRVLCLFCVLHLLVQAWPAMLPRLPACCPPRPISSDPAIYVNRPYSVRATKFIEIDNMNKTPNPIYIYIYTYTHKYISTYVHSYIHTNIHTFIHT